jgi:hypothetical protein
VDRYADPTAEPQRKDGATIMSKQFQVRTGSPSWSRRLRTRLAPTLLLAGLAVPGVVIGSGGRAAALDPTMPHAVVDNAGNPLGMGINDAGTVASTDGASLAATYSLAGVKTALQSPGGSSDAWGINASGQTVGTRSGGAASGQGDGATRWSATGVASAPFTTTGTLFVDPTNADTGELLHISQGYAINASGVIGGRILRYNPGNGFTWEAALSSGGAMTGLGIEGEVYAVGDDGSSAGLRRDGSAKAFYRSPTGVVTSLEDPNWVVSPNSWVRAINSSGVMAGYSVDQSLNAGRATRFSISGGVVSREFLQPLPGDLYTEAYGINDAGWIVGRSTNGLNVSRPFVFIPGTGPGAGVFEIEPGAAGEAFDINNNNEIVGRLYPAGGGQQTVRWSRPDTVIDSGPVAGSTVTTSAATLAFSASPAQTATFECQLDGGSFAPCTSPTAYTGLSNGPHTFNVRASNVLGVDSTPASRSWTVATAPPPPPAAMLKVSRSNTRSPSVALQGNTWQRKEKVYVFLDTAQPAVKVKFFLEVGGKVKEEETDKAAPWDFEGSKGAVALPFDEDLSAGTYTIRAVLTKPDGTTVTYSSTFTVVGRPRGRDD